MALEVYINEELIELKPKINIGLTYQVGSILNLSGRAGNLSNKFTVPKTQINTKILEHISNINSGTDIPYKRNSGRIVQNGIELFPDGLAIIESAGRDYSITVYSGNVSFFDLIKGRNISDLDWLDSCHDYDIPTIIASFTNNSDYIYPIVDWGNGVELLDNTDTQNSNSLLPCARTSVILEKMISNVGYELKGTFKDTDQYSRHLTAPNKFGFSESEVNNATGTANDVVPISETKQVLSTCIDPLPFLEDNPLDYQTIAWESFLIDKAVFDNNYFGTFIFNNVGSFTNYIPIGGYNQIDDDQVPDNAIWGNGQINDTHCCYTSDKNTVNDLILHNFSTGISIVIATVNGSINWKVSMTETNEGYVAYSVTTATFREVKLYEISTATTTTIYSNNLGGTPSPVENLKIWNNRISWRDIDVTGGLFMYDITSTVTKTVSTSLNILASEIDHNGDDLVWHDFTTKDTSIFNYVLGTNSVIENTPGGGDIETLKVFGDYATYFNNITDDFQSFKISTSSLVTVINHGSDIVDGSARTLTKLSWIVTGGQLYWYDLLTDTIVVTIEVNGEVGEDRIDMSDTYISYIANSFNDVRYYNLVGVGAVTTIDATLDQKQKIKVGKSDVIFYLVAGSLDEIKYYDINGASFFTAITDIVQNVTFEKALNNDRLLFDNQNPADDPTTRVAYLNPLKNALSVTHTMQIKENGIAIYSLDVTRNNPVNPPYDRTINTGNIIVNTGSEYSVCFFTSAIKDETITYPIDFDLDTSSFSFTATSRIPYGAKIDFAALFDWGQDKLLKDVLNQYSLTIQTNEITKQVFLTPLDDLAINLLKAKDWSQKIDLRKEPNVKYKLSGYGQTNYFNYKEDDDVEEDFGQGSFDINDTSLEAEKDIITLNSAAAVSGFRVVDHHTPLIPFCTGPGNFFEKKLTRHLLLDPENFTLNLKNTDTVDTGSTSTDIPFCYFKKGGKVDSLDFQSLLDDNYTILQGMTDKIKFISANFILREVDVQNIDFTIPIFLDVHTPGFQANGYFYINKISNFKENAPTKVDLIRL
jgi:hypothetical protein